MKLFACAIFVFANSFAFAETDSVNAYRFTPCSFWRYDFNVNAYVCGSTGSSIDVPSNQEYQREIAALKARIEALENQAKQNQP